MKRRKHIKTTRRVTGAAKFIARSKRTGRSLWKSLQLAFMIIGVFAVLYIAFVRLP